MTKWQTSTPCDLICRLRKSSLFLLGSEVSEILDKKLQIIVIYLDGGISNVILFKKVEKIVTRSLKCCQQEASGAVSFQCQ
jgi:hypothetical protein